MVIEPPSPRWDRGFFFAVLLSFTCDFAIYSPCFKTAMHGAVFGGMGVKIYPKWMNARFLFPRAKRGRFGACETQIELNGHFYGLCTAFRQVVNGE